jgi:hypothetical protein
VRMRQVTGPLIVWVEACENLLVGDILSLSYELSCPLPRPPQCPSLLSGSEEAQVDCSIVPEILVHCKRRVSIG